jgi:hypothetical protein
VHALVTREAGYLAYVAPLSIVFGTHDAMRHVSPPEPSSAGQRELSFMGHTVAPEPFGRGDHTRGRLARGRSEALPCGEVTRSSWARGRIGAFPSDGAGKVLSDMWLLQSPPGAGGGTRGH